MHAVRRGFAGVAAARTISVLNHGLRKHLELVKGKGRLASLWPTSPEVTLRGRPRVFFLWPDGSASLAGSGDCSPASAASASSASSTLARFRVALGGPRDDFVGAAEAVSADGPALSWRRSAEAAFLGMGGGACGLSDLRASGTGQSTTVDRGSNGGLGQLRKESVGVGSIAGATPRPLPWDDLARVSS